ncbi:IscS subfamily cysteine desulfurase [Bacillus seohaeanensis]|uniref:IscS subfamily cysteine desulfurase n=1 Tax=Bacillus seohaeanensis TaxID=284580 RepID=A0ABW5RSH1_9BACI
MKYFDYAATTPIEKNSLEVFNEVSKHFWGNTSSLHDIGTSATSLLEKCREELAQLLCVPSTGIYFTSGGTEGNQLALLTLAMSAKKHGNHIIIGMAEHTSIHSTADLLSQLGFTITKVPMLSDGIINLEALENAIRPETILLSIQHINGEIGAIQPLDKVKKILQGKNIFFHSDFVQSFGKIAIHTYTNLVDSFTVSSHKIYGPKGVGAVFLNPNLEITPFFPSQSHENGFRGGTVNLPGIAAFVTAAQEANNHFELTKYWRLREFFLQELKKELAEKAFVIESNQSTQLPHVIGLCLEGIQGQWLMLEANRKGFAISTGSACHIGKLEPSKTLTAMDTPLQQAKEFIRISFGKDTKKQDVVELARQLIITYHTARSTQS